MIQVQGEGEHLRITLSGSKEVFEDALQKLRSLPGRRFLPKKDGGPAWLAPASTLPTVMQFFPDAEFAQGLKRDAGKARAALAAPQILDAPQPDGIAVSLWKYQRVGVEVLRRRSRYILGDDMGLGKTIQMIGVMLCNIKSHTLIVLPRALMEQWESVIKKTLGHSPLVYHGDNKKNKTLEDLQKAQWYLSELIKSKKK